MAKIEVTQMLAAAATACDEKKAEDIRILALDPAESGLTDYFLICSGTNERQNQAIVDAIELKLKYEYGTYPNSVEGQRQGEWILMDYVDFIVHVFLPEKRAFYGLERLRKSATSLSVEDLNSELRAAISAKRPAGKKTPAKASSKTAGKAPAKAAKKAVAKAPAKAVVKKAATTKAAPKKVLTKAAAKTVAKKAAATKAGKSAPAKPAAKKAPAKKAAKKGTGR